MVFNSKNLYKSRSFVVTESQNAKIQKKCKLFIIHIFGIIFINHMICRWSMFDIDWVADVF